MGVRFESDNFLYFVVRNGLVIPLEMRQHETRGDNILQMLSEIVKCRADVMEGKYGVVYFGDHVPKAFPVELDFVFSSLRSIETHLVAFPFPCPYSLRWLEIGVEDSEALLQSLLESPESPEIDKAFWIGSNSNPWRKVLVSMGGKYPHLIDARLMSWTRAGEIRLKSEGDFVPLIEHQKFRFLIDCPGNGYSARLRWLLASGRPVLIVHREPIEHWHAELVPWKHFVPIKEDLSDLVPIIEELRRSPELCASISTAAREFVFQKVLLRRQLQSIVHLIGDAVNANPER